MIKTYNVAFHPLFTACPKCKRIIDIGTTLKEHKCKSKPKEKKMNFFKNVIWKFGKSFFIKKLRDDGLQALIVGRINKAIDLPNLNEAQEEKLFNTVYDSIEDYFLR